MTENNTKAILVGIAKRSSELSEVEKSLDELERLFDTAGGTECVRVIQIKDSYDPRTLIGSGKVLEISELVKNLGIDLIIFDEELTPAQIRNLENDIGDVSVIDRSMLILDIFAKHAVSGEGKLQVELAQLKYSAPRLVGKGATLSRQGGGIGSRGPGESKLETDRRHVHEKIVNLEARLRELEHNRSVMRQQRDKSGLAKISLVGYTNAGKSTILNYLTGAGVLSEDKLFATLDPTTRKLLLPCGETVLLTDTVGFIRKLPHHLVKAFKSTLDEVSYADILVIVADVNDPELLEHIEVTKNVITELSASDKPTVIAYNKADLNDELDKSVLSDYFCYVSGKTGEGVDRLLYLIEKAIHEKKKELEVLVPYTEQGALNQIYKEYTVLETEYRDDGVYARVIFDEKAIGQYKKYLLNFSFDKEKEDE